MHGGRKSPPGFQPAGRTIAIGSLSHPDNRPAHAPARSICPMDEDEVLTLCRAMGVAVIGAAAGIACLLVFAVLALA